ncbi:zinc finger BED domain-containing protein 1-like [Ctenocephalides felis]|uniref:zinc finger BED domain-containing protein 1-like n=1 Tax=Ctenocephalides felis TaxID=7515 RepID=UPI000E6E2EAA|nr:zinc finger BED domain-containing protein 1-like [Ctenocephalides felis]
MGSPSPNISEDLDKPDLDISVPTETFGEMNRKRKIDADRFSPSQLDEVNSQKISDEIVNMIVTDKLPLEFLEGKGFNKFMQIVEPKYEIPSKTSIMCRIRAHYENAKEKLKDRLFECPDVAITAERWSSMETKSFITVTAHFIDEKWQYINFTLSTIELPDEPIFDDYFTNKLKEICEEWNIDRKITVVVHDIALKVENTFTREEKNFERSVPCFAQSLQMCINNALVSKNLQELVIKSSSVVSHFQNSEQAKRALNENGINAKLNIEGHKLIQQKHNCWKSTFYMFESLLEQKQTVSDILADRSITTAEEASFLALTTEEWYSIKSVTEILKPFEISTTVLCSEQKLTLSIIRPLMTAIINNFLDKLTDLDTAKLRRFKNIIKRQITERFLCSVTYCKEEVLSIFDITSLMDPRYKNSLPEHIKNAGKTYLNRLLTEMKTEIVPKTEQKITYYLDLLFDETRDTMDPPEVDVYFLEPGISKKECPLEWWKKR